jgi:TfoX/Sxy family transcriptional regulator of competence genes
MPEFPRPDIESKAFFASVVPDDPRVEVRPMFGNLAAFVNGNMFAGLFGAQVFVRLDEDEREVLLREPHASIFAPMEDRPMKEYVVLPAGWRKEPERALKWVRRALDRAAALPAKGEASNPENGAPKKTTKPTKRRR